MVRHSSVIELSQSALKNNFTFIRKKIGPEPRISSVVKANAYGHGIQQFVPMAQRCGIDHFAVSSTFEAEEVLECCKDGVDVVIMGIMYDADIPWILEHGIEFFVYDYKRLLKIHKLTRREDAQAKIHIEVETGTNRTGMDAKDIPKAISFIRKHPDEFKLMGVCSHLGGAESFSNRFRIDRQIQRFNAFKKQFEKSGLSPEYYHLACSAAALAYPETVMDMVRIGISQYGFWPSREIYYHHLHTVNKRQDSPFRRVITWKTNVMDIKPVDKGEFVGYGTAFQAFRPMKIAVLPLGYANGYSRQLSNKGHVLIRGRKAPIVGLINMNLFMVDVTHIPGVRINDEVILIGKQKNNTIGISSFVTSAHLINNEMLARLPAAIPRKTVK